MPKAKSVVPVAVTAHELSERIWAVVTGELIDRATALEALERVTHTLRLDQRSDQLLGLAVQGKRPS